jgi:hypothetical protein
MIEATDGPLKAMILLGLNGGLGNHDLSELPRSSITRREGRGWLDFRRPKTGIARKAALWPETLEALDAAIAACPVASDPADRECVFVTRFGRRWVRYSEGGEAGGVRIDGIAQEFKKLIDKLGIERRGFCALRHTYRTVADELLDLPAMLLTMGHADENISSFYRERIGDDRLLRIANHVREWLFPGKAAEERAKIAADEEAARQRKLAAFLEKSRRGELTVEGGLRLAGETDGAREAVRGRQAHQGGDGLEAGAGPVRGRAAVPRRDRRETS